MRGIEEEVKKILQGFLCQRRVCGPIESRDQTIKVYNVNPNLVRVDIRIPDDKKGIQEIISENEVGELRPALKWFAGEMELELKKHDSIKGTVGWLDNNLDRYSNKAIHHALALRAVASAQEGIKRCIHGANYFMMTADNLRIQLEKGLLRFKISR